MKLIYIAGPFNGIVERNVRTAEQLAVDLVSVFGEQVQPVVPHSLGRVLYGVQGEEQAYAGTLELMRRCDAVLMVAGWEKSKGARAEREEAMRLGLPVFLDDQNAMAEWLEAEHAKEAPHLRTCTDCGEQFVPADKQTTGCGCKPTPEQIHAIMSELTVTAAAIRYKGTVWSDHPPMRHPDLIQSMRYQGIEAGHGEMEQGFMLSDKRFVDREEAGRIAIKAGQIKKLKWPPKLYSEDLW